MVKLESKSIDRIDGRILSELQNDGRLSNVELARRVGLSPTPCLERVKRLEKTGYIKGYTAVLNPNLLAAELLVYVEIRLDRTSPDVFEQFKQAVLELPQVMECHLVTGSFDYLVKARVQNISAYRDLLSDTLLSLPSVSGSQTFVVMEPVKESTQIPLP